MLFVVLVLVRYLVLELGLELGRELGRTNYASEQRLYQAVELSPYPELRTLPDGSGPDTGLWAEQYCQYVG